MNISLSKRLMAGVFLVGCPIVLGCSPGSATSRVSGTVTMDGEPLAGVQVTFYPVGGEGRPAIGNTDEGGASACRPLSRVTARLRENTRSPSPRPCRPRCRGRPRRCSPRPIRAPGCLSTFPEGTRAGPAECLPDRQRCSGTLGACSGQLPARARGGFGRRCPVDHPIPARRPRLAGHDLRSSPGRRRRAKGGRHRHLAGSIRSASSRDPTRPSHACRRAGRVGRRA